jgi:hypothetical protein
MEETQKPWSAMEPSTPKLRAATMCVHIHIRGLQNVHMEVMERSEKWAPRRKVETDVP